MLVIQGCETIVDGVKLHTAPMWWSLTSMLLSHADSEAEVDCRSLMKLEKHVNTGVATLTSIVCAQNTGSVPYWWE